MFQLIKKIQNLKCFPKTKTTNQIYLNHFSNLSIIKHQFNGLSQHLKNDLKMQYLIYQ